MTAPANLLDRFTGAMQRGLRLPKPKKAKDRKPTKADAEAARQELERLGLLAVNASSPEEDIAEWCDRLWHDEDDLLEDRHKEIRQILLYCANEQTIAYHRDRRTWIPKRTLPWRVRSIYNVTQKAVNVRVSRLVENKPAVSVQAKTAERSDVERAEYKESLFWYLWERLYLHLKITRARRWATKGGSGFLKCGWDAEAGCEYPVTTKRVRLEQILVDDTDELGNVIGQHPEEIVAGIDEFYVDAQGNELGPTELQETDPATGEITRKRAPVPENTDYYREGEAYVDSESPFGIRYDRYVDDIADSWYVQHARVLPVSKIAAMHEDKLAELEHAKPASEDEKALQWNGLTPRGVNDISGPTYARNASPENTSEGKLDEEFLYLETWIFPKNRLIRRLWGASGQRIVTVGGTVIERGPLPKWATKTCPFIQLTDILEEGNHLAKSAIRDLVPIQDDINRTRSMMAERLALASRLLLWAPNQHGLNVRAIAGMNAALVTTRSPQHKPEALSLDAGEFGLDAFYQGSLAAAADIGNMNEASTGKLPSAGLAAKAIFALQYADERSITEASTLQDISLKRLAEALDAITREEYKEARKIKITGADRSYLAEHEITPEHLAIDVDYTFQPGSMMSRQKEAVKNEMFEFLQRGLVTPEQVKKNIASAVPDLWRTSYDLHEAKARRNIEAIIRGTASDPVQPAPFDNPMIHLAVLEEFMITAKYDLLPEPVRAQLSQLWQAFKALVPIAAPPAGAPGAPPGAQPPGAPPPSPDDFPVPAGADELAGKAEDEMAPPEGFPEPLPATA
jgi:hypothetical protein